MTMRKFHLLLAAFLGASHAGIATEIIFADHFTAPNGSRLNEQIETRTLEGTLRLIWNTYFDETHNDFFTIQDNQLYYFGPGDGSTHPDKLFLSNPNNFARVNFAPYLAGERYEIGFSVKNTGTDGADAIGFTIHNMPSGAQQGVLSVRQLRSRSIVDVFANGERTRFDPGYPTGEMNHFRMLVDETETPIRYKVFRNGTLMIEGNLVFNTPDRYIYLQIADSNRNGSGFIDQFQITKDPPDRDYGPGIFSAYELLPGGWVDTETYLGRIRVNEYPKVFLEKIDAYGYSGDEEGWIHVYKPLNAIGAQDHADPGPGIFQPFPMIGDNWVYTGAYLGWIAAGFHPWFYITEIEAYAWSASDSEGWFSIHKVAY